MKHIILIILAVLTLGVSTPKAKAWFGDEEKQRRIEAEQKLVEQQQTTRNFEAIAFVLGIGCVVTLVVGTIIGSKARRHASNN